MAAPITKSLAVAISTETVGIPLPTDKILYAPLPVVPFVDECKAATIGSLFSGGSITNLVVSGHAAIGPQAAIDGEDAYGDPSSYQIVNISETIVAQVSGSDYWMGGNVILKADPSGALGVNAEFDGWDILVKAAAGNVHAVPYMYGSSISVDDAGVGGGATRSGMYVSASKRAGAGNLSGGLYGVQVNVADDPGNLGTIGSLVGFACYTDHGGSGVLANLYGVRVQNGGASGPVTNAFGLKIEDFSAIATLAANSYNLYSAGATAKNRFEGAVLADTFIEGSEIADPAAPAANKARLYTRDNGGGKTQIVARFPTGAVQVIATEP